MKKFLLPLLFLFLFIFESLFVQFLPEKFIDGQNIISPHFLLIAIMLLTIYGSEKHGIIYGMLFGFLYDIVYTEVLGINLCLFPLIAYFIAKMMKVFQVNLFTSSLASIVGVALLEICVFGMNKLIGVTTIDFMSFLNDRFFPTLLINAIVIIILIYPLKWQFEKFAEQLRAD
jgi:rod shape-determining protein MreD